MIRFVMVLIACLFTACSPIQGQQDTSGTITLPLDSIKVFVDAPGLQIMYGGLAWSRQHVLETGGCYNIFNIKGYNVFVTDVTERVVWRRQHRVQLDCTGYYGSWHTHYERAKAGIVDCNMRWVPGDTVMPQDIYHANKDGRMYLVICGFGLDSVIPYAYDAAADSAQLAWDKDRPVDLQALLQEQADTLYHCKDESVVSLRRPHIYCIQ